MRGACGPGIASCPMVGIGDDQSASVGRQASDEAKA
jgi:hypothetical protein